METLAFAFALMFAAVWIVALSAIGMDAYRACKEPNLKDVKKRNFNFIIVMLVFGVLSLLISFWGLYKGVAEALKPGGNGNAAANAAKAAMAAKAAANAAAKTN